MKRGKSKRGQWSKAQKDYVSRCLEDGCIICGSPAQWHHEKERFHGVGMRAPHEFGLPLCPYHHTDGPDSIHRSRVAFERLAGASEAELVDRMQREYGWS